MSLHAEKKASAFKPRFFSGVLKMRGRESASVQATDFSPWWGAFPHFHDISGVPETSVSRDNPNAKTWRFLAKSLCKKFRGVKPRYLWRKKWRNTLHFCAENKSLFVFLRNFCTRKPFWFSVHEKLRLSALKDFVLHVQKWGGFLISCTRNKTMTLFLFRKEIVVSFLELKMNRCSFSCFIFCFTHFYHDITVA